MRRGGYPFPSPDGCLLSCIICRPPPPPQYFLERGAKPREGMPGWSWPGFSGAWVCTWARVMATTFPWRSLKVEVLKEPHHQQCKGGHGVECLGRNGAYDHHRLPDLTTGLATMRQGESFNSEMSWEVLTLNLWTPLQLMLRVIWRSSVESCD